MDNTEILLFLIKHTSLLSSTSSMTGAKATAELNQRLWLDTELDIEIAEHELYALDIIAALQLRISQASKAVLQADINKQQQAEIVKKENEHVMDKNRVCPACNKPFVTTSARKKYCSINCGMIYNKAKKIAERKNRPIIKDVSRHYIMDSTQTLTEDELELQRYISDHCL